jgi:hypothetical protein
MATDTQAAPDDTLDDSGKPKKAFPPYDEDSPNLVSDFLAHPEGIKALEEIAARVLLDSDTDFEAGAERRDQFNKDWRIFRGTLPKKNGTFAEAANCHVPIAIENVTRNTFRAYSELFGDWDNVFGVSPLGPDDQELASLLTLHGNWQIRSQILDFQRQMARGMLTFFFTGDVSGQSYWNPETEMNRHEVLTLDDLAVPYVYTSTMPDYSDVPHLSLVLYRYRHELEHSSEFDEDQVRKVLDENKPSLDDEPSQPIHDDTAKDLGQDVDVAPKAAPYKLIAYDGWLMLPLQEKERYCKVVVDYKTKTVLQLLILEEPDWQDQQRFDAQMQELTDYRVQFDAYEKAVLDQQVALEHTQQLVDAAAPQMGMEQQQTAQEGLDQANQFALQLQPPIPPQWSQNPHDPAERPEPVKRVPVYLKSHAVLIEPLVGGIGLGYGTMECDFNRAANTALSQLVDEGALSNCGTFIVSDIIEFAEKFEISPGKLNRVTNVSGDELKANIMPLQFQPPSPVLAQVVENMRQYGSEAMQSSPALSGDPGKSGEPFRGYAARVEQATKQLSVPTRGFANTFLVQILRNNAKLNAKFLKDEEFFHVAVSKGAIPQGMKVSRSMYARNYHVEIRADLRFVSQSERVQEAMELMALPKMAPQLMPNAAFMYQAVKQYLMASDRADMVQYLGNAPGAPVFFGMPSQTPQPQLPAGAPPGAPGQASPGPPGQAPGGVPPASPAGIAGTPPMLRSVG